MSHQEEKSVMSFGNDRADAIANDFRQQGELVDPCSYFTLVEEQIILQCNKNNVQGDVRQFLKGLEKEKMLERWITKTKIQSQWIQKYPTQIFKQAKRVWEAAILRGDDVRGCILSLRFANGSLQTIVSITKF